MKESRQSRPAQDRKTQLSADAERLVTAALGMANSGSRIEDRFWDRQLALRMQDLLDNGHSQPIYDALERLNKTDLEAYGALVETVEETGESVQLEIDGQTWQILLVVAPIVAWTRFHIPSGAIDSTHHADISKHWLRDVFVKGAQFHLEPILFSVDQLPRDFSELRRLTRRQGLLALGVGETPSRAKTLPGSADMLADSRYLLGAVAVPVGQAVFRWQAPEAKKLTSRVQVLEQWLENVQPTMEKMLPGCGFECLLPDAYHINMRESDRRVRPYSIRAAVHYLTHALEIEAPQIKAVIGGYGRDRVDEYRIGLLVDPSGQDVAHGIVWPLLGAENEQENPSPLSTIRDHLSEAGITEIRVWPEVAEPEYCEDCGAPLYPNLLADVVHAELPTDVSPESVHFH